MIDCISHYRMIWKIKTQWPQIRSITLGINCSCCCVCFDFYIHLSCFETCSAFIIIFRPVERVNKVSILHMFFENKSFLQATGHSSPWSLYFIVVPKSNEGEYTPLRMKVILRLSYAYAILCNGLSWTSFMVELVTIFHRNYCFA